MFSQFQGIFICLQHEITDEDWDIKQCAVKSRTSNLALFSLSVCTTAFVIPMMIMAHNYVRVSYTLLKSLKQNVKLMEGNPSE